MYWELGTFYNICINPSTQLLICLPTYLVHHVSPNTHLPITHLFKRVVNGWNALAEVQ